jgi:Tol biopolymer transport system component/DNA-binding winged helix-turn-helix (wHTH) protein
MAEPSQTVGSIRFGRFEFSADSGELRKDGQRLKLFGQAIQVLAMLVANPGKLVTREELQQKLWPGASFGDPEHGLNAAVNKLREALGDSATEPTYIETVPGRGYRFIGTLDSPPISSEQLDNVVLIRSSEPEPPAPKPPKPAWWKRKLAVAVATCALVAGLLYPWIAPQIERQWRLRELQQLKVVPLTALPGNVWSPSFSPDGSQIAFEWDGGNTPQPEIYVKVIGNDEPLRLTHGGSYVPVWSPDGKSIAFCRQTVASDSGIFLVSPLGGPERKITSKSCNAAFGSVLSWSPDGKQLAFLHHPADSLSDSTIRLFVLSLASLDEVPVKTDCNQIGTPAFSSRGDYLAWTCLDNISDVSINLQRLSDGKVIQLLRGLDGVGGLAWSGVANRLVFSTGTTGGDLWEVELGRLNRPEKLPLGHDATDIAVRPAGDKLAFRQSHLNTNIWRVDLSNPQTPAEKIVASSREQTAPDYSPDGTQIAFSSNRSGSNEVWVSDADGSNAVQLSSFGIYMTGAPHWSPDGKLIAFDSRVGGEANIYVVDPHVGVPRKLDIDVRGNCVPSWSHDGRWIYFVNVAHARNPTIWRVPSKGGHAVQIVGHRALFPLESPDGQYVYFSRDLQLWRVKTDGTEEQQVDGMPRLGANGEAWRPFGSGIYYLGYVNNEAEIDYFDLSTRKVRQVFVPQKHPACDWMGGLPVSSDGRWLLYAQVDERSSNLMLVENWR